MRYQRAEPALKLDGLAAARAFFAGCFDDSETNREIIWVAHLDDQARCLHLSRHDGDRTGAHFPIREIIADASLAGKYSDGDPLPSVRALAAEEQANPLTVAKAYQGFQDEGLVVVRRGVGMFVAPGARAKLSESERSRFLKEEWPQIRARMRRLGINPAELMEREGA